MTSLIIDKLRKLQALADRAGTEAEAAAAMLRVQEILAKHNLDIGVLELKKEEGTSEQVQSKKGRHGLHVEILARACDEVFNVRHYISQIHYAYGKRVTETYCFMGLHANVETACITFSWLIDSVESLLQGFKRQPDHGFLFAQWTRADYEEFRKGAAIRIHEMAKKQARVAALQTTELVHIGNAVATRMFKSIGPEARYSKPGARGKPSALLAGYEQGSRVDFHGARKSRMVTGGER